ncbi:hypothetical protein H1O16_gp325 [Burkholderia phage BcepSaruman]|uniref:Uncharacterized protein n=1 Tax=Burkholderia phage BcepSaruman TaxID=2530032 RepID=A0A4D5ZI44_9CAUD|nr:hypothetical protein H1O16_gp325 [Burkholderia phage BcepSaruman]QBX06738.1 hypothetical protein BcepSaruman_325 [Burkholderia phage BcepSaruman]
MAEWNKHHGRPLDRSAWTPEEHSIMDAHEMSTALEYLVRSAYKLGKIAESGVEVLPIEFPFEYSGYRLAAALVMNHDVDAYYLETGIIDPLVEALQRYEESGGAAHIGYKTGIMGNELAPAPYH